MIAIFPGQGSQYVGMGKSLFNDFSVARGVFEECSDSISVNLKSLCFEGPESDLMLTNNLQPSLLAVSIAAFRVLESEYEFKPAAVAGHSLGEYSALVAAGSIGLSQATRWVRERGAAMQEAVPAGKGGMTAVIGESDQIVEQLCKDAVEASRNDGIQDAVCEPANYNSPGQVVIAGTSEALKKAHSIVETNDSYKKCKLIDLSVSAPFHSRLMELARDRMEGIYKGLGESERPKPLNVPYVPNRTARITNEHSLILDLLVDQIDHPVLWKQTMDAFFDNNQTHFLEIGPGNVLSGLAKRTARPMKIEISTLKVGEVSDLSEFESRHR